MLKSFAKINLTLDIIGIENNLHLMESLVTFAPEIYDVLTVTPHTATILSTNSTIHKLSEKGNLADKDFAQDNLIIKAYHAFKKHITLDIPHYSITLKKDIPLGAGLGGGSGNAAALLNFLKAKHCPSMPETELQDLAYELGFDIPVCLRSKLAFISGHGNRCTSLTWASTLYIVLANPGTKVSTAKVFCAYDSIPQNFSLARGAPSTPVTFEQLKEYFNRNNNDLTMSAAALYPEIQKVLTSLKKQKNILNFGMSGSGSTCFATFTCKEDAENCHSTLSQHYPWVRLSILA